MLKRQPPMLNDGCVDWPQTNTQILVYKQTKNKQRNRPTKGFIYIDRIIGRFRRSICQINRHDERIPKHVYFLYSDFCDVIYDVTKFLGSILY